MSNKGFHSDILYLIVILWLTLLTNSCELEILPSKIQTKKIENELSGSIPLEYEINQTFAGLYLISEGNDIFGDTAVVISTRKGISIFFKKEQTYIILDGGIKENQLIYAGFWRYSLSNESGYAKFSIISTAYDSLIQKLKPKEIRLLGELYISGKDKQIISLTKFSDLIVDDFLIVAHRGGGRNVDRLPFSENSKEIIEFAERLGANGIELDVQITKDKIPVLYHDEYLNKRLINQDYFIGKISDYDYEILKKYVTLKNNEIIPTLKEVLETIIHKTDLKFVWLDIKSPEAVQYVVPIQYEYQELASLLKRNVEIVIGLPTPDILNEFVKHPLSSKVFSLCEFSPNETIKSNSKYWAPRWTLGYLDSEIEDIKKQNRKVVTWTLDVQTFIRKYIRKAQFDGILSNYPFMVNYEYNLYKYLQTK